MRVKALEWKPGDGVTADELYFTAETVCGRYWCIEGQWGLHGRHDANPADVFCDTDDEAKAAAQADFEARILSCIEPAATNIAPTLRPLSTYPESRSQLLALCVKLEKSCDDETAIELADHVRAILDDEAVAVSALPLRSCPSCHGTGDQGGNPDYGVCEDCDGKVWLDDMTSIDGRFNPAVEAEAQRIYESMAYDGPPHLIKPKWVPHGNSDKQEEARRLARDCIPMSAGLGASRDIEDVPAINAAPKLIAVARMASQLASIASDWNLDEVEIDGKMIGIYALKAVFDEVIAEAEGSDE